MQLYLAEMEILTYKSEVKIRPFSYKKDRLKSPTTLKTAINAYLLF